MRKYLYAVLLSVGAAGTAFAGAEDDPLLAKLMIDKLEWRSAEGDNPIVWDGDAWVGKDLNKLWLKSKGEYVKSDTEAADLQVLYSRAIAPYWDFQAGWRHDFRPKPTREWFAIGFKGLAPYLFEVDATAFVGESGRAAFDLEAEYELLFTQRLILSPEIELAFNSKDDEERGIGSGLSVMELGLRLRYEIRREFAPYIGVNWEKKFGDTKDYAQDEGESTDDVQLVLGVRSWF